MDQREKAEVRKRTNNTMNATYNDNKPERHRLLDIIPAVDHRGIAERMDCNRNIKNRK
jgi:hypothetical protein